MDILNVLELSAQRPLFPHALIGRVATGCSVALCRRAAFAERLRYRDCDVADSPP